MRAMTEQFGLSTDRNVAVVVVAVVRTREIFLTIYCTEILRKLFDNSD